MTQCPKCTARSGDDWLQCRGECPMPGSPHHSVACEEKYKKTDKRLRIEEIIEDLRGTCKALHEVLEDGEENDMEITNAIDMEIFMCEGCGWWCEASEAAEDKDETCKDCADEEEEIPF